MVCIRWGRGYARPDAINEASGLASPQAPSLRLKLPLLLMAGVLEGMKDELGYKSLGMLREDEIGCNGPHESI